MHFNLAPLLAFTTALAAPFTFASTINPRVTNKMMTNANMTMNTNTISNTTNVNMTTINSTMGKMNNMNMKRATNITPLTNETSPLGHAVVVNNCQMAIYVWSVGQSTSGQSIIQPGDGYAEVYRRDPKTGGVAIKITTVSDGLYTSAPQTVFAYNLVDNMVWYDLSDLFGDPFEGDSVSLLPSEPAIRWEEGVPPSGSQVRVLQADNDLILNLCIA
ncbi:Bys1 family protein [Aspergillus stella-maris]|uniref:Bys1 family protein n=1 Tax=Aspergillus stella-maris TaxID=1810926 RepID=UPI003CCDE6D7